MNAEVLLVLILPEDSIVFQETIIWHALITVNKQNPQVFLYFK